MLSPIPYLVWSKTNVSLAITATLIVIATSVILFIYIGMNYGRTYKKENVKSLKTQKIENIVYTTCVAIFLLLGLVWGLFHIAWIVFLLGYVVVLILTE